MADCALAAAPLHAGASLSGDEWREVRARAIFEFCKWDVQCEDHSVLAAFPLFIDLEAARFLNEKAEALAREALAAEEEILQNPRLLEKLGLPRAIRKVLQKGLQNIVSSPELRVMRFDFHRTPDCWRISEVNSDVPGGFIEATGWNSLFAAKSPGASAPPSTSDVYAQAIRDVTAGNALVALVHATAYSDDRQVMQHLARCFSKHGLQTYLCSPTHVRWNHGIAEICGSFGTGKPDAIVRFFPAEWLPNLSSNESWEPYFRCTTTPLSNPGSAIVLQTKRFPLVWDELRADLCTWRELLPETRDFSECDLLPDDAWILKPALGRVGEDVGIQGITPPEELRKILCEARKRPGQWIAQQRFKVLPVETESGDQFPCIGVFTIGGKAAGFYGRISSRPIINQNAQDVAVLIDEQSERRTC